MTGSRSAGARNAQLASQLNDLIPIDSLTRMSIAETSIPAGVSGDVERWAEFSGRVERGRPVRTPQRRESDCRAENVAALEAASLIEFMWAREGRGIVRRSSTARDAASR